MLNKYLPRIAIVIFCGILMAFSQTPLKKATFIPHWLPQAQFAGYYYAYETGIYRKHGIDLKILTGGPNNPASVLVEKGGVDFASFWLTNAIQLRDGGVPILHLAQIINRSALMLVAKKSSGITKPQDMQGRKVGIWGGDFQIQPMAFFEKYNLKVRIIPQGGSINLFLSDAIDVTSAMWYNEYHTILNSGLDPDELSAFFFSDYGLNFPEDGLYCLEKTYARDPQLCKEFIQATYEGWVGAFENPEKALEIVLSYMKDAKLAANNAHQRWMLNRMKDLIFPQGVTSAFPALNEKDYRFVSEKLLENRSIKDVPDFNEFCSDGNRKTYPKIVK
ncbi:MAG: ABC transporter substrate-binding protein [Candidatus Neomarinimicrobiota bacterium]